jgi:hypothetical protein
MIAFHTQLDTVDIDVPFALTRKGNISDWYTHTTVFVLTIEDLKKKGKGTWTPSCGKRDKEDENENDSSPRKRGVTMCGQTNK